VRVLARVKEDEKGGEVKKANGVAGCDFHFFFYGAGVDFYHGRRATGGFQGSSS
jgi:hypothetical protein